MKKNSKDRSLLIIGSLIIISFFTLAILWFVSVSNQKVISLNEKSHTEKIEDSNAVFSEDLWRKQLELFLDFQKKEQTKEQTNLKEEDIKEEEQAPGKDPSNDSDKDIPKEKVLSPNIQENEAFLFSSLTGSPGSVSVSGKAIGYSVLVNDSPVEIKNGKFNSGASSSFTVTFKNNASQRIIRVTSPSYSTNLAVQYLSIGIDPFAAYMTLHVKLNLKLPGTMTGELINVTNGSASSTRTQNGEFNLSVPLSEGNNSITARGSWLTISLDLPSINVSLSN
jgi:hypothetical protein